jgi:hypothetical protein
LQLNTFISPGGDKSQYLTKMHDENRSSKIGETIFLEGMPDFSSPFSIAHTISNGALFVQATKRMIISRYVGCLADLTIKIRQQRG